MPLRDYQQKLVGDALDAIRAGKNPLVVLPPGGGKTHVMAAILEQFKRTLSIAHRVELTAKLKKLLPSDAHQVATVQSGIELLGPLELLAIDEAHHAPAKTYQRIIDDANCPTLGVTATPCRMDGRGLGSIFDVLLEGPDVATLTEMGYLMPFDLYSAKTEIDVAGISKGVSGDYAPGSAAKAATARTITADAVQEWLDKAGGRQTIVFTCTVDHARQVQQQYLSAGIRAEVITGGSKDRHELLPAFERKEFPVLINCEIAIEGIDIPSCECVQILRPTNSIRIYDQMIGRLLRPSGRRGVILDHAHTWERLGYPFAGRTWSLDGVEMPESELRVCPVCGAVSAPDALSCGACGYSFDAGEDSTDEAEVRVLIPTYRHGRLDLIGEKAEEDLIRKALKLEKDGYPRKGIAAYLEVSDAKIRKWLLPLKSVTGADCVLYLKIRKNGEDPSAHWWGYASKDILRIKQYLHPFIDSLRFEILKLDWLGYDSAQISESLEVSEHFIVSHLGCLKMAGDCKNGVKNLRIHKPWQWLERLNTATNEDPDAMNAVLESMNGLARYSSGGARTAAWWTGLEIYYADTWGRKPNTRKMKEIGSHRIFAAIDSLIKNRTLSIVTDDDGRRFLALTHKSGTSSDLSPIKALATTP
jgi:DNA repair protein RadD